MPQAFSSCHICNTACSLLPETGVGYFCNHVQTSVTGHPSQPPYGRPQQRRGGELVPVSWEEALSEISGRLRSIIGEAGPQSLGLYLGPGVFRSPHDWLQAIAFGVSVGTSSVFTSQCMGASPQLLASEWMIGHPAHILSDIGRAHYVLLLGEDLRRGNWTSDGAWKARDAMLRHSRRTKKAKVAVAAPRKSLLADEMDLYLGLRPGTEPFFLLGLVQVSIQRGWLDRQYIRDYTRGFERLEGLLAAWPVERCAEICGLDTAQISGLALKFSRAPMGVVHLGHGSLAARNSTLGAWAWLALHMLSANLLRPGGLYENAEGPDIFPFLSELGTSGAPRTVAGGHPLILMQAPVTGLADELHGSGRGEVRALLSFGELPAIAGRRLHDAVGETELLVSFANGHGPVSQRADWVLPVERPFGSGDPEPGEARTAAEVIRELHARLSPSVFNRSGWGRHFRLAARGLAGQDLTLWGERIAGLAADPAGPWAPGEGDRSLWRPSGDLLDFVPDRLEELLSKASAPVRPKGLPLLLRCAPLHGMPAGPGAAGPSVFVHPSTGLREGDGLRLKTEYGSLQVSLLHDDRLLPGTAEVSPLLPGLADVLPAEVDPWTGMPVLNGTACALEATK